jgi:hypothetical protein
LPRVFIVLIACYSVSLFSPGGGLSVQGAMLIWPRVVCGSTMYGLAHLVVHVFPSSLGTGHNVTFLSGCLTYFKINKSKQNDQFLS